MNTSEIMSAMIFGDGGASKVEELSTDGGSTDAGKVLVVGDNGKIAASDLTVGEGEVAIDKGLVVNGAAADAKVVGDAITSLNGSLGNLGTDLSNRAGEQLYNITELSWITGSFIKTAVSVGNTVSTHLFSNASWAHIIVPVSTGDRYVLTALGGGDPRTWAFTDSEYKMLRCASANYHAENEVLVAEQDGYLIVNTNVSETERKLEKTEGVTIPEYFDADFDEINNKIGEQIYSENAINWIVGSYIKTAVANGTVVDTTPITNSSISYAIIPVSKGDKFKLTAKGGSDPRTWAFTDSEYKMLDKSVADLSAQNLELVAGKDGYLIVNTNVRAQRFFSKLDRSTLSTKAKEIPKTLKDYGAIGDGITDDTYAIMYALYASQGKTLIIPEGTFLFSQTLTVFTNTHVVGCGTTSVLKQASDFSYTNYNWRGGNKKSLIILPQDTQKCVLRNFVLDGQTAQFDDWNIDGLTVMGAGNDVRNLTVSNIDYFPDNFVGRASATPGMGIMVINASDVVVDNCNVYNCGYEGIGTESAENVTISNCRVGDANQTGIQIHRLSKYIKVTGNTVKYSDGKTNGSFTLHADEGFDMSDIYIRDNYFGGTFVGVAGFENNIFIENNTINGNISQNNPVYAKNWIINGNNIYGRIYLRVDGLIIANNFLTVNSGYIMIYAYGYNSGVNNNVALGSVSQITQQDRG